MTMAKGDSKAPLRRKRAYELDGMKPISASQDPLRQIEAESFQDLADEYRTLKMEKLVSKQRRENARMKGESGEGGPLASNADFMKMARLMADLEPEEQKRVANAYAVLRMADKGQVGGSLQLLAPLLGFARQNPGASEEQMLKYLTLMDSQLMKGLELSRALSPGQPEDSTLKLLGVLKELLPVLQSFRGEQQQGGVFDKIMLDPNVYNRFKDLGMFGGGSSVKNSFDLDLERLRGDRELEGRKFELQMRKMILESEAKERRTDRMLGLIPSLSAMFAGPIDDRMRQMGRQATHNPGPAHHTDMSSIPPSFTLEVNCEKCGFKEIQTLVEPIPETITCPRCGNIMNIMPPGP